MPPEKHIVAYAATASLAAITLVYVFAPTWFIDSSSEASSKDRKRGVVGLNNLANDCFVALPLMQLPFPPAADRYTDQLDPAGARRPRGPPDVPFAADSGGKDAGR